jgi:hypothetical protein
MKDTEAIHLINQIQDELGIKSFPWFVYSHGLVMPPESLTAILSAIIRLKEKV